MRVFIVFFAVASLAQHPQVGNPAPSGEAVYRSNCAGCHGVTGKGGRGPDLTGRRNHGDSDADVARVIKQGISGTTMPAYADMAADELKALVAFVATFRSAGSAAGIHRKGDVAAGRKLYESSGCAGCHRVNGIGGIYGPDLTRIGAARSHDYIRDSIGKPSADIPPAWEGVTVITKDRKTVTGIRVNEDTFTIQLRGPDGAFRTFEKSELQSVRPLSASLMPAYQLEPASMDHLLAYLDTLRGAIKASGPAEKVKGIR